MDRVYFSLNTAGALTGSRQRSDGEGRRISDPGTAGPEVSGSDPNLERRRSDTPVLQSWGIVYFYMIWCGMGFLLPYNR